MKYCYRWLALLPLLFFTSILTGQNKLKITQYQTRQVRLVYLDKTTSYLVPHTVRSFENALLFHKHFWDYVPSGKTNILFNDFTDVGNGGTSVIPWNFLNIAVSPFDYTFSVVPSNERMQWLMSHELTHQVMCDKASRGDRILRGIFGGKVYIDNRDPETLLYSYFTTPRWYSPRWYHEGIAVFMETWMSGGIGRTLGGYDEMVFRTMVRDSSYFYNVIGLESEGTTVDFQVGVNSYLYGTRFVSYLAYTYGIDKLKEFYSRTDTSRRFYASQFRHVYSLKIQDAWNQWISFEHGFQKSNLEKISAIPVSRYRPIGSKPLGSVSAQFVDKAKRYMYVAVNYPMKLAHISRIDIRSGEEKKIAPVPSPALYYVTGMALDDSSKTLFITTHNSDWRGLRAIDVNTGRSKDLIKIDRTGNLAFNSRDHSLWGVQTMAGRTMLVRFLPPYKTWDEMYSLPFGKDLCDLDFSPDGKFLAATLSDVKGSQKIVIFTIADMIQGKKEYREIYEFEDNPAMNFVFSPDGKYLYGSSYYTGVSNIFRVDIETRKPEILSNATSGFFRPLPISADSMLMFEYTTKGMIPGMMKIDTLSDVNPITFLGQTVYKKNPVVESWILPPPSKVNIDTMGISETKYKPLKEMKLAGAYPILQGYKNYIGFGYRINFADPMMLNNLVIKFSFTPYENLPLKQTVHLSIDYTYWNWTFQAQYNYADFYDLFGPTKFSRAGYMFSGKYSHVFMRMAPAKTEMYVKLAAYGDLETLPFYQNIESSFTELYVGTVNFHRSYLRKSLGAIEAEQGYDWSAYAFTSLAKETFYPQLINNFDLGFLLPMKNSSLWFRTSLGQSFGETDKTNSYFYFGGFGNNWVDYRSVQQYREMQSFPGVQIDQLSAMNYAKLTTEIDFPPIRFRKFGLLGFYSTYARFSAFGIGLFSNLFNNLENLNYYSTGAQVDLELVLFSLIKSNLSFGYARAYGPMLPADQFMLSLKL